jgi:aminoglycoside phosphotransferase (APT) family kinase protein
MTDSAKFSRLVQRLHPAHRLIRAWQLTGGVSAQITALEVAPSDGTTQKMIVRQHGEGDLRDNPNIAADEFKLLSILQAAGINAPEPYYLEASGDIFGTPCIVIEFIDGATEFSPPNLPDFVAQMAAALAQIHAVPAGADLAFLPRQSDRYRHKIAHPPAVLDDSLDEGRIRAMLAKMPSLPALNPSVLLHGDYWAGNLLWRAGKLAGVIDWEDAVTGDPLSDLGNARMEIFWTFGAEAMQQFTDHYRSLMPTLNLKHLPEYELFAALRPAGRLSTWFPDPAEERHMRERHHAFVAQAFARLPRW